MIYQSTRNENLTATSTQAVLQGLAPDGGLYIRKELGGFDWRGVLALDTLGMAERILAFLLPDFENMGDLVRRAYAGKFETEDLTPLAAVGGRYVLELFRGPTSAFKDVALSMLPQLITAARRQEGVREQIVILTATSGDTGKAALEGFRDVEGTRIVVFYPEQGVSQVQKAQMVTQEGSNVCVCAVRGNFDDAQTGVKDIFAAGVPEGAHVRLSSANSINIGRLAPQVVYYFSAYRQLLNMGEIQDGDKVNFVVPTGNFGDIMAGYFAREMGLPVGRLVCASNSNDVLREFLETGHYNRKRDFHKTTSPSMDILVSSNLERLLCFVCGVERTKIYMDLLAKQGEYTITEDELKKINEVFSGVACDDARGAKAIGDVFRAEHYLMDTHTAIAWAAYEECRDRGEEWTKDKTVVLSTASPYKFTRAVLAALGEEECPTDEECMQKLKKVTQVEAPVPLQGIFERPICHTDVIDVPDMKSYVVKHAEK